MAYTQRMVAEFDLDNLIFNYRQAGKCAPGSGVYCVVKANGYGHGAAPAARALAAAGADHFAVATPEEALQLRRHGIKQPLLLLGMVDAAWIKPLAEQDVAVAVGSLESAHAYAAAAPCRLKVHIKLDTGMGRIGLPYAQAVEEILAIAALPAVEIEGMFAHFSASDEVAKNDFTNLQMARFNEVKEGLAQRGLVIPVCHCANSAATISMPHTHADMVRPGLMLYGCTPLADRSLVELRPVLTLKARIVQVWQARKGESVGYGRAWYAPRDSMIATVSAGYADGFTRFLSGKLPLLVKGEEAPLVGRICMDMCMIDVTDIPGVKAGDYATIIGTDGEKSVTAYQLAEAAQTIPHEIFCAIGLRVPRFYYQGGQLVEKTCYMDEV